MAARSLIARLQVCDIGLVVTVGVLFLLDVSLLGRFPRGRGLPLAARSLIARLQLCDLGLVVTVGVLHVGLLGLLFVSFWAEG